MALAIAPLTPPSSPRGYGSDTMSLVDTSVENIENIENVAYDLKSRERCSFIAMLKALMLRQIVVKDSGRKVFKATAEEREAVDQKFKTFLDDAVGFVNGSAGKNLRQELKKYCGIVSEKARYRPFVTALNEMLLHSRKLKSRGDTINDSDIIFAINGPAILESYRLAKRKPPLVCLLAEKFKSSFGKHDSPGFNACMSNARKIKGNNKKLDPKEVSTITWGNILQSWELHANGKINSEMRTDFNAEEFLDADDDEISSASAGSKRKRSSPSIPSSKKIKIEQSLSPVVPIALKELQCAFYGIERLRHSMDITHSMSILLSDEMLTLYWYDSQGCIEADNINIIEELPLLVIMIRIFEDFPLGMWGYTPINVWTEDENQQKVYYCCEGARVGSFQIKGRRSFTADATKISAQTAIPPTIATASTTTPAPSSSHDEHSEGAQLEHERSEDILFLKSAWPEVNRRKEPEVIKEAYKRAEKLLETEAPSVTEHLPIVVNSEELTYTSTEIIRHLVRSTTTDGFRVQLWMLSKKLQPIHTLDPKDFWVAFWHTIRCHALLWRIGIAHGDVSLHNLMYKEDNKYGVLNDFDLSTIMNPGDRNPNLQGLERTGTLPFMALELLEDEGFDGKIPRRYDHELESFSWVLVWVSRCVLSGHESERPPRLHEWLGNSNHEVFKSKVGFITQRRKIPTTSDYETWSKVADNWVWDNHLRQDTSIKKTDTELLQVLVAICQGCAGNNALAAVPIDVTWINGLTNLEFTAPTHLSISPPRPTMAKQRPFLPRNDEQCTLDGGEMDMSDEYMYAEDDPLRLPDDTEFEDTDGDDDRQSGRSTDAHTSRSPDTNNNEGRGGLSG